MTSIAYPQFIWTSKLQIYHTFLQLKKDFMKAFVDLLIFLFLRLYQDDRDSLISLRSLARHIFEEVSEYKFTLIFVSCIILMIKAIKILPYLLFSIVLVQSTNVQVFNTPPYPYCESQRISQQYLPVSGGELQQMDLDDYFTGYNLSFYLSNQPSFTFLTQKTSTIKETKLNQSGLKSHQHEVDGSTTTLITMSENREITYIGWGSSVANDNLPGLIDFMIVQADPSIICFDAVWMWKDQRAIADCATIEKDGTLSNIFIVADTATHSILKIVSNPLSLSSRQASNRKLKLLYQNSKRYLFRAYLATDDIVETNTYGEVWSFQNFLLPTLKCKIDTALVDATRFVIRDFQVDQNTIYILDWYQGVTRWLIPEIGQATVMEKFINSFSYRKIGVFNTSLENRRVLALGGDNFVEEYDWSQSSPRKIASYSIPAGKWHNLEINEQFIMAQVSPSDSSQMTYIYRRGRNDLETAHAAILHNSFTLTTFILHKSSLIIITQIDMVEKKFDFPILYINPPSDRQVIQYNVMAIATSQNQAQQSIKCNLVLRFLKLPADDLRLFFSGIELPNPYYTTYPGQTFVDISDLILGSNITYGVQKGPTPSAYILKQNSSRILWENSKLPFSLFYQIKLDSLRQLQFYLISQEKSNLTRFSLCFQDEQTKFIACEKGGIIASLKSRIISLAVTAIYDGGQFSDFAAICQENSPNKVSFFDSTGKELNVGSIVLGVDEKVIDMTVMLNDWLVVGVTNKGLSEIAIFDLRACLIDKLICQQLLRLDSEWFSSSGLRNFQIMDITVTNLHPNLLFVSGTKSVVIIEVGLKGAVLIAQIKSPATVSQKWKATVGKSSLIIANTLLIEEYDLTFIYTKSSVYLMKQFPLYQYKITNPSSMVTSEEGNMTYIAAIDPNLPANSNSIILIYEHQKPTVLSFFDVYKLESSATDLLLQTITVNGQNLITSVLENQIKIFRSIQRPQIVFQAWPTDYRVNITYTNDPQNRFQYSKQLNVHIKEQEQHKHLSSMID